MYYIRGITLSLNYYVYVYYVFYVYCGRPRLTSYPNETHR